MRTNLLCIFVLMGACGGKPSGDAIVEMGTGQTAFESLVEDQDLVLVAGMQGGFHFIVNASMSGIEPGDPTMPGLLANPQTGFSFFTEGGDRVDARISPYRLGYRERTDSELLQLPSGRILPIADGISPDTIYDQRIRLRVEIRSNDEVSAVDEVHVMARRDPNPPVGLDAGPDAPVAP